MSVETASWDQLTGSLEAKILGSSTKLRVSTMERMATLIQNGTIDDSEYPRLSLTLLKTYNLYSDAGSRETVLTVFEAVLGQKKELLPNLVKFVFNISTNGKVMANSDYLTLLTWINAFELIAVKTAQFDAVAENIIISQALLLNNNAEYGLIGSSSKHRRRIGDAALVMTRHSIQKSLIETDAETSKKIIQLYVNTLTASKTLPVSAVLVLLGSLARLVVDMTPSHPNWTESLRDAKTAVLEYTNNSVFLSKVALPNYSLKVFGDFIYNFIDESDFTTVVIPTLEKANLRSPEVSFKILRNSVVHLNETVELSSALLTSKLLAQILSNLKSSKEDVREDASKTLELLLRNNIDGSKTEELSKIVDEVLKALRPVTSADQKALFAEALSYIPTQISKETAENILTGLTAYVSKDQNEVSLPHFVHAYLTQFFISQTTDSKFIDVIKNGLSDKKVSLRRIWFVKLGERLSSIEFATASDEVLLSALTPSFVAALNEVIASPLPSITNKSITSAYVVLSLANLIKGWSLSSAVADEDLFAKVLIDSDKPSLISNSRIYTKLSTVEEQTWYLRALYSSLDYIKDSSVDIGKAWVYFTTSSNVSSETRRYAISLLTDSYLEYQEIVGNSVLDALWEIVQERDETVSQDDSFNYDLKYASTVIAVVTQQTENTTVLTNQVKKALFLSLHSLIPVKNGWVGVCQRSGLDPGAIVNEFNDELIERALDVLSKGNKIPELVYQSIINSITMLAFIGSETVPAKLAALIDRDLQVERLKNIDSSMMAIWRANDGELVVNVLDKAGQKVEDKNSKDYETRKWEEGVRKELAAKKAASGATKRLTKEEQALVNEQLAKEKDIRQHVEEVYSSMLRSIRIIDGLANDSAIDNGRQTWYSIAVNRLLDIIPYSSEMLGQLPIHSFLNLSNALHERLGLMRKFMGVATLRILEVEELEEDLTQEPILDLISRVLFRVKFLSDQRPLDSISLTYLIPLLTKVLENGKTVAIKNSTKAVVTSEFVEEDKEEEQLLLAMEIVSTHNENFEDTTIPRDRILEVLLSLMKLPSKAKIAKECFLSLCQHISVNISPRDLSIILTNAISSETFVRNAVLEALDSEFDLSGEVNYFNELWIAVHDNESNNAEIAQTIWDENELKVVETTPAQLSEFFGNVDGGLRLSIANAYASAVETLDSFDNSLELLLQVYNEKAQAPPPIKDAFGLIIKASTDQKDRWEERSTVALALKLLAPQFKTESAIIKLFSFLIEEEALGDNEPIVRQELQDAGVEVINLHGFQYIEALIPVFEKCLGAKDQGSKKQDVIRESVIILYGALARHLKHDDYRLEMIVEQLLKTLDTPSEDVQYAVSECIAPLVPGFEPRLRDYFDDLFEKLFNGKSLAKRRGAAYGLAGLVKGAGIKSLANNDIIRNLVDAAEDKKDSKKREGVSFAFECLSQSLGKYFEPYVIEVLPILLKSLGDQVPEVREATDYAARRIMKNTTSFGVKKLIPLAIENLDEIAWRSKKGSVELLGSMAYLDPAQLSSSLSTIVPEIVGVLNDSHKEVRKAADQALKRFGEVIRNPEIQKLVPVLINAIGDPTKYTESALDELIKTQFVHYIDGPSLALIIHVIHRGMKERSASTKRKSCQIVGNMAILVDSKDLIPYLPSLIQELEVAMVDPVPTTRATAARALGSLVEKLGEDQFPDLIPRLLDTLRDEAKAGDRLGSAQALAEVISGLGIGKLDELLPTILSMASSPRAYIREGFMPLLLFLPVCFGNQFSPYLSRIIPPILNGLADSDESIRETALRAGRLLVKNYANKAVDLLLPELENGLSDSNYRIRLSSVELTGDLLFQVTGISGKNELNEDQQDISGEVNKALIEVLSLERRDRILSSLFVCRSDVSGMVRNASVDIWKALVANTPRTIKEILPTLTQIIVRRLASPDQVQRTIAAQTLGELVRRVGSNALSQLLPTLEESLSSSDVDAKQGICIAIHELINSTQEDNVVEYEDTFINIIRSALIDSNETVRESAAQAFEVLQNVIGKKAIDEVIPYLLNLLDSDNSENALLALQDIMATKSDVIFPILLPTLLSPPMDSFKARVLGSLAVVAGSALYKRLSVIINALVDSLVNGTGSDEDDEQTKSSLDKILLSVEEEGVHPLMQQLLALIKHEDSKRRAVVYERLGPFFTETQLDYSIYTQDLIAQFILSLDDPNEEVVKNDFIALSALVKRQSKESLEKLVKPAYQALQITGVKGVNLPGFSLPRGPNSILPIFLHGLMYGTNEQRELSAQGIADIVERTPSENLKPFVTVITGPLIRVIGERFSSDVKAAILYALHMLFVKIPQFLRPFIPQLQRTFVKSLSDPSNDVLRSRAAKALGVLIEYQPRVDPLVSELVTGAKNADEAGVKTAMLRALLEVVSKAGKNMNETSKNAIMTLVEDEITSANDKLAVAYARLVGSLSRILSAEEAAKIIKGKILGKDLYGESAKFSILSLNAFLRDSPIHVLQESIQDQVVEFIIDATNVPLAYVSDNAATALGKILLLQGETQSPVVKNAISSDEPFALSEEAIALLVNQLALIMVQPASTSVDTRRLALVVARTVSRFKYEEVIKPNLSVLAPSIFSCVRDSVIPIKLAAEKAYLALFDLLNDESMTVFNTWFEAQSPGTIKTVTGTDIQPRSISDYTKRVAVRLAGVERERIAAGGDEETMFSDRFEDEKEVWAVGGVDLK